MEGDQDKLKIILKGKNQRKEKYKHDRLDMDLHFTLCEQTNGFQRHYHLCQTTFDLLVCILDIQVDYERSHNASDGNEPILLVMIVASIDGL